MFGGFIRNQIKKQMKKYLQPLKQHNIKLSCEEYENVPSIVASNLPSNYEFVFSEIISALRKFGVSYKLNSVKNVLVFNPLPSQHLEMIKSCVDDYNSGRF